MLRLTLGELLAAGESLTEASTLTYDQLFRRSDPKRTWRSSTVRGPPLEIDAYKDAIFHTFNFKSYPSTTGLRHRGYIKFEAPKHGRPMPSEKIPCVVDCTCPDFRYRWAWANKQRGASRIGDQSLNKCIDRAPRKTNPGAKVGLCKHLLHARNYIYGLIQKFDKEQPAAQRVRGKGVQDMAWKLDQLVKYADKRWTDWDATTAAGKKRQQIQRQVQQARNIRGPMPAAEVPRGIEQEVPPPLPPETAPGQPAPLPKAGVPPGPPPRAKAAKQPTALPPQIPPTAAPVTKPAKPTAPAVRPPTRRGGPNRNRGESLVVNSAIANSNKNTESMKDKLLTESKAIIEALSQDDDELAAQVTHDALAGDAGAGPESELPPPPVEGEEAGMPGEGELPPEAAAGPEAPEDEALSLLRDIAAGIQRMADEVAPVEAAPEGSPEEEAGETPEEEAAEHKEGEEAPGVPPVEDDDEKPGEAMPVATGA